MTENNYNQSQTQFAAEEPILEKPVVVEEIKQEPNQSVPKKKLPKWAWWVIGWLAVMLVIVVIAFFNRAPQEQAEPEETEQRTVAPEYSPLEKRLLEAEARLRQANPNSEKLPLPPLTNELRIDSR